MVHREFFLQIEPVPSYSPLAQNYALTAFRLAGTIAFPAQAG